MSGLAEQVATLDGLISKLPVKDQSFASSLVQQYKAKGKLSDKQKPWVETMIQRATGEADDLFVPAPLDDVSELIGFFNKAKTKHPDVILITPSGNEFRLYQAGVKAKYPGAINVVLTQPENWLGRVLKDGTFQPNNKTANTPGWAEIVMTIRHFSKNPVQAAASYGKVTGKCCFCNRKLEDGFSTAIGYGPICASNFHLPWGSKAMKAEETH